MLTKCLFIKGEYFPHIVVLSKLCHVCNNVSNMFILLSLDFTFYSYFNSIQFVLTQLVGTKIEKHLEQTHTFLANVNAQQMHAPVENNFCVESSFWPHQLLYLFVINIMRTGQPGGCIFANLYFNPAHNSEYFAYLCTKLYSFNNCTAFHIFLFYLSKHFVMLYFT